MTQYKLMMIPGDGGRRPYGVQTMEVREVNRRPSYADAVNVAVQCMPSLCKQFGRELTKEWLAQQVLCKGGVGLEIGVDYGDGAQLWLKSEPSRLYLVDPWVTGEDGWYSQDQDAMDERYEGVVKRFEDKDAVEVVRMTSDAAFETLFSDTQFLDWVHVDGDHEEEPTYRDLENSWARLKVGGVLMLDDVHCALWQKKIRAARDRFLANHAGEYEGPLVDHSDPWAIRRVA